jgi:hypothetical protein
MRQVVLAVALAVAPTAAAGATDVSADASTTIYATPHAGSSAGQKVIFMASFTFACGNQVNTHYFVIDKAAYSSSLAYDGRHAVETLSLSTLSAGRHAVSYHWDTTGASGQSCQGGASLYYTVTGAPAQTPTPPAPPVAASPVVATPSPRFANEVAAAGVRLKNAPPAGDPNYGYLALALIGLAVWAGVGLIALRR